MLQALIFDVDGTLAETEEVHRDIFNKAFKAAELNWHWDKSLYVRLPKTTGGNEHIARFVSEERLQETGPETLAELHIVKNEFYAESLEQAA